MMLAPPGREYTLAIITLLTILIIHPIIPGQTCNTYEWGFHMGWLVDQPSPLRRLITFDTELEDR